MFHAATRPALDTNPQHIVTSTPSHLQTRHLSPKHAIPWQQADVVRLFVVISRPLHASRAHDRIRHSAAFERLLSLALPRQHAPEKVERTCGAMQVWALQVWMRRMRRMRRHSRETKNIIENKVELKGNVQEYKAHNTYWQASRSCQSRVTSRAQTATRPLPLQPR